MSRTVWKHELTPVPVLTLNMPAGAALLHVGAQGNTPCLWALVDPSAPYEMRTFYIVGTGHPLPTDGPVRHVGTALMFDGSFVLHVFEAAPDGGRAP